ncbi:MAG TPA: protein-glutamate O-methyltransferase CheR [Phycisphaerae bacterium]|nr:protein-glutamate O-methyltransferase CheR [Phycisphaerae bacterium]HRY66414.1 protein-glutamate O-methyltransferase CheR [Phycisphaerae bacterium]HSA25878.1 protein-glutamate O-methyltransferase CheR [Phycisphaerae bacterium]
MHADTQDLTRNDYELIRRLVYAKSGINLGANKMQLVRARLGRKIRTGEYTSFRHYFRTIEADPSGEKLCELLDAITTNTTHLFREIRHFHLLSSIIKTWVEDRKWCADNPCLRIWSAACSSGEEPHSIAMIAHDALLQHPGIELKILATDLSVKVLSRAKLGTYEMHRVGTVPANLKARYFQRIRGQDGQLLFQLIPELRKIMTFSRFNLMTPSFPFRHGFHVIFCRNVMIYFDRQTQHTLVNKLASQLRPGGFLMIGHSESLNGIDHPLMYVEPTVYQRQ